MVFFSFQGCRTFSSCKIVRLLFGGLLVECLIFEFHKSYDLPQSTSTSHHTSFFLTIPDLLS